jgi:Periplasmic binding protein
VDDPQYSNVTELAQHVTGRTTAGAEQILHFHPDMIFVASYSKSELVELLHMAHVPVFRCAHFDHIDDIKMNIRTIGYIIGEDDKAEALVQHMERDMAQARASIPHDAPSLRMMLYGQAGYTGGAHDKPAEAPPGPWVSRTGGSCVHGSTMTIRHLTSIMRLISYGHLHATDRNHAGHPGTTPRDTALWHKRRGRARPIGGPPSVSCSGALRSR